VEGKYIPGGVIGAVFLRPAALAVANNAKGPHPCFNHHQTPEESSQQSSVKHT